MVSFMRTAVTLTAVIAACLFGLSEQYAATQRYSSCNALLPYSNIRNNKRGLFFPTILVAPSFRSQLRQKNRFILRSKNDENNSDQDEISQTTTRNTSPATTEEDNTNSDKKDSEDWNTSLFPAKIFPPPFSEDIESIDEKNNMGLGVKNLIKQLASNKKTKKVAAIDVYDERRFRTQFQIQGLAATVGLLSGIAVSGFKMGIETVKEVCYTSGGFGLDRPLVSILPIFAITTLGGVAVAIIASLGKFPPGIRGEIDGVDDASLSFFDDVYNNETGNIDTWKKKMDRFNPLYAFAFIRKAVASIFTLGVGCSLGPEGPSVEVAMAMSRVCMFLWPPETTNVNGSMGEKKDDGAEDSSYNYSAEDIEATVRRNRLLLSCGAAAGVSAGFNAPIAGVFFALEVVQSALPSLIVPVLTSTPTTSSSELVELRQESLSAEPSSITAILIASVVSGLVARILLGNELALVLTTYEVKTPLLELPLYLLLGGLSGLVAVAFSQSAKLTKRVFDGDAGPSSIKKAFSSLPRFASPVIGALTCGIVGSFCPQVLFFGYETLNGLLSNNAIPTLTLLTFLAAKIFTTAVSAGSGLVGGTFAPALFLGGMCGASFHNIVQFLLSSFDDGTTVGAIKILFPMGVVFQLASVPAYAMVGAASTLAALFRAPLTASLLLFELTRNYDILIPLLASAGVGSLVSDIVENKIEARKYQK